MESELINLLVNGGPFGAVAAFFFYKWQKAESDLKEERASNNLRNDANHKAMIELQEKRIGDVARVEGIVASNTSTMSSLAQLVQVLAARGGAQ